MTRLAVVTREVLVLIVMGRVETVFLSRGALGVPKDKVTVPDGVTSLMVIGSEVGSLELITYQAPSKNSTRPVKMR